MGIANFNDHENPLPSPRPDHRWFLTGWLLPLVVAAVYLARWDVPRVAWLGFSPDGNTLAALIGTDSRLPVRKLVFWDVPSWKRRATVDVPVAGHRAAFSPDSRVLAMSGNSGRVSIRDTHDGHERFEFRAHDWMVTGLDYSPDGRMIATAGAADEHSPVRLWDAATGELRVDSPQPNEVYSVAFSPDGHQLAVAGLDGPARVGSFENGTSNISWQELPRTERFVLFSPDGKMLLTGQRGPGVQIWKTSTMKLLATVPDRHLMARAITPDGRFLLTGGFYGEGTVRVWELPSGQPVATVVGTPSTIYALAVSSDGQTVAVGSDAGAIELYDASQWRRRATLVTSPDPKWPLVGLVAVLLLFALWCVAWIRAGMRQTGRWMPLVSFAVPVSVLIGGLWLRVWCSEMETSYYRPAWMSLFALLDALLSMLCVWVALGRSRWPLRLAGCVAGLAGVAYIPIFTRWQGHMVWILWDALGAALLQAAVLLAVLLFARRCGLQIAVREPQLPNHEACAAEETKARCSFGISLSSLRPWPSCSRSAGTRGALLVLSAASDSRCGPQRR